MSSLTHLLLHLNTTSIKIGCTSWGYAHPHLLTETSLSVGYGLYTSTFFKEVTSLNVHHGSRYTHTLKGWLMCCLLVSQHPSNMLVSKGGVCSENCTSCQTDRMVKIKLVISPSHSILTPDQPVLALIDRLVGLGVKASASRGEDLRFKSRLCQDFSGVKSYQWHKNWQSSGHPSRRLALYRVSAGTGQPGVSIL